MLLKPFRVEVRDQAVRALRTRLPVVVARAINKSAVSVRAVAAREMSAELGLRVGDVREQLRIERAQPENLAAEIRVRGTRIPLIAFHAGGPEPSRGRGRGVSYRIGTRRGRIRRAFIATMRSGHRGVFVRRGRSVRRSKGAWTPNLPIVELFGPSLPKVFQKREIVQAMQDRYREMLPKTLRHEIEFELSRLSGVTKHGR